MKKFLIHFLCFFVLIVAISAAKRPYTTPSPFGTYRFKSFKCSCNDIFYYYLHRNHTCYVKAVSRDVTTAFMYVKLKKDINKFWVSGMMEYKYGTIYRPVITTKQIEGCETIKTIKETKSIILQLVYSFMVKILDASMIHVCPYKAGSEVFAYNVTFDMKSLPSIFNQGDYRLTMQLFLEQTDKLVCNDTIIYALTSPIKESFGRK